MLTLWIACARGTAADDEEAMAAVVVEEEGAEVDALRAGDDGVPMAGEEGMPNAGVEEEPMARAVVPMARRRTTVNGIHLQSRNIAASMWWWMPCMRNVRAVRDPSEVELRQRTRSCRYTVTEISTLTHLPCYFDKSGGFNVVQVFTLGEASWRDVPVSGATCCLAAGVTSIDGKTYWVTKGPERVASFDLEDERVTSTRPLPVQAGPGYLCYLTDVRGRLGVISSIDEETPAKIEVWVLGDGRDREAWTCRYRVHMHGVQQQLSRPYFAHGDYLLTNVYTDYLLLVYGHRLSGAGSLQFNEVRISQRKPWTAMFSNRCYRCPTFAYVETTEPLSVYRLDQ
ncbi:hypothetical protein EJB05_48567, partial [Eragrostis curvula]